MRPSYLASVSASLLAAMVLSGCVSPIRSPREAPERPSEAPTKGRSSTPRGIETSPVEGVRGRIAFARSLLGSDYRYGGETPRGFDCSGFSQYVFKASGVPLPRTAEAQAEAGYWVPLDELAAGDLVFFSEVGAKPHHVGVVVSRPGEPLRMIHASTSRGVVETDVLEGSYWLRRLSFGRRVSG